MHQHILGICGTFMGGLALLARALGHRVTGSDANVYPPMSTQLELAGIDLMQGYEAGQLDPAPDMVIVGNAMKRGLSVVEAMLDRDLPYTSGPQWLAQHGLRGRHVLAVAGTHGKTTAASMLTWVLDQAGLSPGFLIGGVPMGFGVSARLGDGRHFVIEADEYDTAFFDKRSKFVHYRPRTLILNNLEFDHADIFDDLAQIQRQFHHLVRTVPAAGRIVHASGDKALDAVLAMGCWTPLASTGVSDCAESGTVQVGSDKMDWQAELVSADGSAFRVWHQGRDVGTLEWSLIGLHNAQNAIAAIAAAEHVGIGPSQSIAALASFLGVKRRMELRGTAGGVRVYDDFAHHPTAIASTLHGLRRQVVDAGVIAVLEPRSNTMRMGSHSAALAPALKAADLVIVYSPPELQWDAESALGALGERLSVCHSLEQIVNRVATAAAPGDHVLVMSNGGFGGVHQRLLEQLGKSGN